MVFLKFALLTLLTDSLTFLAMAIGMGAVWLIEWWQDVVSMLARSMR